MAVTMQSRFGTESWAIIAVASLAYKSGEMPRTQLLNILRKLGVRAQASEARTNG
jgi:hypothetical protein